MESIAGAEGVRRMEPHRLRGGVRKRAEALTTEGSVKIGHWQWLVSSPSLFQSCAAA